MRELFGLSVGAVANINVVLLTATFATTYTLYVFVEHKGPAFLPMLSDTFVPAPGNYISRIVLSGVALTMAALNLVPYFGQHPKACLSRRVLLASSTVATVCLGVVGAVCEDDTAPSCMGDLTVHDYTAGTFFAVYDVYATILSVAHLRERQRASAAIPLLACALRALTKLRFVPQRYFVLSSTWLAVLEYTDTAALLVWIKSYMTSVGQPFKYGLLSSATAATAAKAATAATVATAAKAAKAATAATVATPANLKVSAATPVALCTLSVAHLSEVVAGVAVGTVAGTFGLNLSQGAIHPLREWPMISDLWMHKPSNMLSRYFVCLGGFLVCLTTLAHHAAVAPHRRAHARTLRVGTLASVVGACGLCGVGAVNEGETLWLHAICAMAFFGGIATWAVCDVSSATGSWVGSSRAAGVICIAVAVACKLAQIVHYAKHGTWRHEDDLLVGLQWRRVGDGSQHHPHGLAVSEWLAFASIISYFYLANHATPASRTTFVGVYRSATPAAEQALPAVKGDEYRRM